MKIALFSDVYIPAVSGVATSSLLLRNELIKRGHQVYVYTVKDPAAQNDVENTIRLPSLPFVSQKRITVNLNPSLKNRIKAEKFEIIHSQTEFGLGLLGKSIALEDKIPFVHTFHTIYEDFALGMMARWPGFIGSGTVRFVKRVSRNFCNAADEVIVPTQKAKDLLLSYKVSTPMHIIPTGLELNRFNQAVFDEQSKQEIRSKLNLTPDDFVLLYLGRVSNEKNIDELLDYVFPLLAAKPSLKFVITGEGAAENRLMRRVKREGFSGKVIFTGPVAFREVPNYYAMADLFVSASQSETQGLTYIEALAAGLPILVRDDPCLKDVVQEGYNGYYFSDQASFNLALTSLMATIKESKREMASKAYTSVARFDVTHFVDNVLGVYSWAKSSVLKR